MEVLVVVEVVKLRQLHAELMTAEAMDENAAGLVGLWADRLVTAAVGSTVLLSEAQLSVRSLEQVHSP